MKKEEQKSDELIEGQIIESNSIRNREDDVADTDRSSGDGTPIYLTPNSTLQSPAEHTHDEGVDPRKDTTMEVSNDDLHDIKAGTLTGRDDSTEDDNNQ
jgi:hypothetical protein